MEIESESLHAQPEDPGNFFELEAEEILDLGAGDQDGDAIGEADDDGPGNELDGRAHAREPHDYENGSGHYRAHEKTVDTMGGHDAGHHDYEGAGRAADLGVGSAEGGDDKPGDDGAVDSGLGREAGGDGKCHGERQRHQTHGDSRHQVAEKFIQTVITQTEDRLGEPALVKEGEVHGKEQFSQFENGCPSAQECGAGTVALEQISGTERGRG